MSEYCKNCFELAEKLAKKEQECEELKEKNKVLQKLVSELEYSVQVGIELDDRYRKALDEIEGIIKQTKQQVFCQHCAWYNTDGCDPSDKICGDFIKILDIINKAKGEGKCQ